MQFRTIPFKLTAPTTWMLFLTTMLFIVLNSVPLLASPATISCTYVWATWQGLLPLERIILLNPLILGDHSVLSLILLLSGLQWEIVSLVPLSKENEDLSAKAKAKFSISFSIGLVMK